MDLDAARKQAGLKPLPPIEEEPKDDKPKCKHGCPTIPCLHTKTSEKHKQHPADALRGIPMLARSVGGAVNGTRPGIDTAADLEQAGRDILRAHLNRNRYRPEKP